MADKSAGAILDEVEAERARQIKKGYDAEHDDLHGAGELAGGAAAYALSDDYPGAAQDQWPWIEKFKPKDRRTNMIRAMAMLLAEVERLDRIANQ